MSFLKALLNVSNSSQTVRWRPESLLLAGVGAVLMSCGDNGLATEPQLRQLERAVAMWNTVTGGRKSYVMEQSHSCECHASGRKFRLTIDNDQVVAAVDVQTGQVLTESERSGFMSVGQLFERIRITLLMPGAKVQAEYHTGSGYPSSVYFDPHPVMVDDEISIFTANVATPLD